MSTIPLDERFAVLMSKQELRFFDACQLVYSYLLCKFGATLLEHNRVNAINPVVTEV